VFRSVALDNSFFLNFTNNSSTDTTLSLFNLGENGTAISHQKTLNTILNLDLSAFLNASGTTLANTTIKIQDSSANVLGFAVLTTGTNIFTALPTAVNPITDLQGNVGKLAISPTQASSKIVNIAVSYVNAYEIVFTAGINNLSALFSTSISSFSIANPLITIGGTIPYYEIKQSETGNVYRVLATDFYSTQSMQILEPFMYGYKDAFGNRAKKYSTPTIDPYAPQGISIQNLQTEGLLLYSTTIFEYRILAYSFVRMTFNYVKARVSEMLTFGQAFSSQLIYETEKMQREIFTNEDERKIFKQ
jgi:hypothetical protein